MGKMSAWIYTVFKTYDFFNSWAGPIGLYLFNLYVSQTLVSRKQ